MESKKNKNVIIAIIIVVLICIIGALIIKLSSDKENNVEQNSNQSAEFYSENTEGMTISTSYGELYYPKQWEKNLKTKTLSDDGQETVQFWAKIDEKDKVHLFDIIFGGDTHQVGTIESDNGDKITVNVTSYDLEIDKEWTEREKDIVYTMSESINYTLGKLEQLKGFKAK